MFHEEGIVQALPTASVTSTSLADSLALHLMLPNVRGEKKRLQDLKPLLLSIILFHEMELYQATQESFFWSQHFQDSLVEFIVWHFSKSLPVFYLILIHASAIKEDFFLSAIKMENSGSPFI